MDAEKKWRERRRMQVRDDVDDGVECGGAAWVSWLGRVREGFRPGLSTSAPTVSAS
jgi:hypothetical protein